MIQQDTVVPTQVCYKCKETKTIYEFAHCKNRGSGRKGTCKKCLNAIRAWKIYQPGVPYPGNHVDPEKPPTPLTGISKTCSRCGLEKDVCAFPKGKKVYVCKMCNNMRTSNIRFLTVVPRVARVESNLAGQKFGMLKAKERCAHPNEHKWLCVCECGKEKAVMVSNLFHSLHPTKSCGCLSGIKAHERGLPEDERIAKDKFSKYKNAARKRGYSFNLTYEEFVKLTVNSSCYYCGDASRHLGVDRVDSLGNYTTDNCVTCCPMCNWMKLDFTQKEFIEQARRIAAKFPEEVTGAQHVYSPASL